MSIDLIAKIAPKNDGFVGMVDAKQVIGGVSNALPSTVTTLIKNVDSTLASGFLKVTTGTGALTSDTSTYLTSVTAHNLLSATHGDTTASTVSRGDLVVGIGASPTWDNLALGTVGKILRSDGTDLLYTTSTFVDTYAAGSVLCANTVNVVVAVTSTTGTKVLTNTSGTITWETGGGGGGATPALDNLASVAVNAALIPGTAGALDFGSTIKPWASIWFAGTSGTPGTNQFKITGASTGGLRTITVPDASGTITLLGNTSTGSGSVVLATNPTMSTPVLGVATCTTINALTPTALATGFSIAGGTTSKTLTVDETMSLTHYVLVDGTRVLTGNWLTSAGATEVQFRATGNRVYSDVADSLTIEGNVTTKIGKVGDIILGDGTLRVMYPQTTAKIDLGKSANAFNDLYCANITITEAKNIVLGTTTGTKIGTGTTQKLGFYNSTPVVQQTDGAALTNSVTSGGTTNTIADFTNLTVYATDAATIRNDIYQLARKLKIVDDALRLYGLLS